MLASGLAGDAEEGEDELEVLACCPNRCPAAKNKNVHMLDLSQKTLSWIQKLGTHGKNQTVRKNGKASFWKRKSVTQHVDTDVSKGSVQETLLIRELCIRAAWIRKGF